MTLLLALLLTLQVQMAAPVVTVLWDTRNGPVLTVGAVGRMSDIEFRREALRLLSPTDIRIGTFLAYPTQEDLLRSKGYGGTDCTYENWRAELDRRRFTATPLRCPEVSQAIKIGSVILVRRVDAKCQSAQEVVQGDADPLRLELSGAQYRVLDVFIQPITQDQLAAKDVFSPIHFFAQTDREVRTDWARELLRYFQKLTAAPDVTVILRNDQWFVTECDFPVFFLFGGVPSAIPSEAELLSAKQAACVALKQWPVRCY